MPAVTITLLKNAYRTTRLPTQFISSILRNQKKIKYWTNY